MHQEGENAVFAVQDNGGGIPPKLLPVLFSGTLRHSDTPTGDGKAQYGAGTFCQCNAIVRARRHNARTKNRDGGAEFHLLPADDRKGAGTAMNIREKYSSWRTKKSIAHFISTILNSNDYETLLARSGSEAGEDHDLLALSGSGHHSISVCRTWTALTSCASCARGRTTAGGGGFRPLA